MKKTNLIILLCLLTINQAFTQKSQSFAEHWFGEKHQQSSVPKSTKTTPNKVPAKLRAESTNSSGIITLDLSAPTNPPVIELNEKGYWAKTYNTAEQYRWLQFGEFAFSHVYNSFGGEDVGGGMSYWDGFTYCTSGDTNDYGEFGSSDSWVAEQWGCMAGGGINK